MLRIRPRREASILKATRFVWFTVCTISVKGNRLRERVSLPKHFCPFSISHKTPTSRVAFSPPSPSSPTRIETSSQSRPQGYQTLQPLVLGLRIFLRDGDRCLTWLGEVQSCDGRTGVAAKRLRAG